MISEIVKLFKDKKILSVDQIHNITKMNLDEINLALNHLENEKKIEKINFCSSCNSSCSSCSSFNIRTYKWKNNA